jgi:hypothetical protein
LFPLFVSSFLSLTLSQSTIISSNPFLISLFIQNKKKQQHGKHLKNKKKKQKKKTESDPPNLCKFRIQL